MKNCPKCNAQVNDTTKFCPSCGTQIPQPVTASAQQPTAFPGTNGTQQTNAQPQASQHATYQQPSGNQRPPQSGTGPTPVTPPPYYANTQQATGQNTFKNGVNSAVDKTKNFFFNTTDESTLHDQEDVAQNKVLALVSYLHYFFFIPMIIKPQSRYLRFHGNQGLTLFICSIALAIVHVILCAVFRLFAFAGPAGAVASIFLICLFSVIIYGSILLWTILGIYNAVTGKAKELPLIGRFRLLKEF